MFLTSQNANITSINVMPHHLKPVFSAYTFLTLLASTNGWFIFIKLFQLPQFLWSMQGWKWKFKGPEVHIFILGWYIQIPPF
jgi:hypothetical protein